MRNAASVDLSRPARPDRDRSVAWPRRAGWLASGLVIGALAGGGAWRLQGDQHVASATLQVVGAGASADPSFAESHIRLAASAAVLSRVIAQENLSADPEFMPAPLGSVD